MFNKIWLVIIFLSIISGCSVKHENVKKGAVFINLAGSTSIFASMPATLKAIEFIHQNGQSTSFKVNRKIDLAYPHQQFIASRSLPEGSYSRIKLRLDLSKSSGKIYGLNTKNGVSVDSPADWYTTGLINPKGELFSELNTPQTIEIPLLVPFEVKANTFQSIGLLMNTGTSFIPVVNNQTAHFIFSPDLSVTYPEKTLIRGQVNQFRGGLLHIDTDQLTVEISDPDWLINDTAVKVSPAPDKIEGATVEFLFSNEAPELFSSINLIAADLFTGTMIPSPEGTAFMGYQVMPSGEVTFIPSLHLPASDDKGAIDTSKLLPGQRILFHANLNAEDGRGSDLVITDTEMTGRIVDIEGTRKILPFTVNGHTGEAFYAGLIKLNTQDISGLHEGDIIQGFGTFQYNDGIEFDLLNYQPIQSENAKQGIARRTSIIITFENTQSIEQLIGETDSIPLTAINKRISVLAIDRLSNQLITMKINDLNITDNTQFEIHQYTNNVIQTDHFDTFSSAKKALLSHGSKSILYLMTVNAYSDDKSITADKIALYLKDNQTLNEQESRGELEELAEQERDDGLLTLSENKISLGKGQIIGITVGGVVALSMIIASIHHIYQRYSKSAVSATPPSVDSIPRGATPQMLEITTTENLTEDQSRQNTAELSKPLPSNKEPEVIVEPSLPSNKEPEVIVEPSKPLPSKQEPEVVIEPPAPEPIKERLRAVQKDENTHDMILDENDKLWKVEFLDEKTLSRQKLAKEIYSVLGAPFIDFKVAKLTENEKARLGTDKPFAIMRDAGANLISIDNRKLDETKGVGVKNISTISERSEFDYHRILAANFILGNTEEQVGSMSKKFLNVDVDVEPTVHSRHSIYQRDFSSLFQFKESKIEAISKAIFQGGYRGELSRHADIITILDGLPLEKLKNITRISFQGTAEEQVQLIENINFRRISLMVDSFSKDKITTEEAEMYFKKKYGTNPSKYMESFTNADQKLYINHRERFAKNVFNTIESDIVLMKMHYGEHFLLRTKQMTDTHIAILNQNLVGWIESDKIRINEVGIDLLVKSYILSDSGEFENFLVKKYGIDFRKKVYLFSAYEMDAYNYHDFDQGLPDRRFVLQEMKDDKDKFSSYFKEKYNSQMSSISVTGTEDEKIALKHHTKDNESYYFEVGNMDDYAGQQETTISPDKAIYLYSNEKPGWAFKFGFSSGREHIFDSIIDDTKNIIPDKMALITSHILPEKSHSYKYIYIIDKPEAMDHIELKDISSSSNFDKGLSVPLKNIPKQNIQSAFEASKIQAPLTNLAPSKIPTTAEGFKNPTYRRR